MKYVVTSEFTFKNAYSKEVGLVSGKTQSFESIDEALICKNRLEELEKELNLLLLSPVKINTKVFIEFDEVK